MVETVRVRVYCDGAVDADKQAIAKAMVAAAKKCWGELSNRTAAHMAYGAPTVEPDMDPQAKDECGALLDTE